MARKTRRILAATLLGGAVALSGAIPALAHVELVSSTPGADTEVATAPATIELIFSTSAEPAGSGVVLVNSSGAEVDATVDQPGPEQIIVTPLQELDGGRYSVMWTMKAGDAHPKSGSIAFLVTVPSGGGVASDPTDDGETFGSAPSAVAEAAADAPFRLEAPNTTSGDWLSRIGRWAAMLGALVGIGAFTFAATALIGTRREVQEAGYWIRRAGVVVIAGTVAEMLGMSILTAGSTFGGLAPSSIFEVLSGAFGIAIVLRLVAGVLMVQGTAIRTSRASTPVVDPISLLGGPDLVTASTTITLERPETAPTHRLDLQHSMGAVMGTALIVVSYLFDGHTVTAAPAPIVRVANVSHVMAAGVWLGGVLLLGATLTSRWRRSVALDAAHMAVRFSRVASVAVAGAGVAGVALTWSILDSVSEMYTTPWGRLLVVKVLTVGIAAGIGAYNHFKVVPILENNPDDDEVSQRLRRLVRVEGVILLFVVAVTAVFVGVAS